MEPGLSFLLPIRHGAAWVSLQMHRHAKASTVVRVRLRLSGPVVVRYAYELARDNVDFQKYLLRFH